jgi:predicted nucleotidyltransferase
VITQAAFFNTVPDRDYLQFWQSGRFQPQRVVRFLSLSKAELAQLAGIALASVRFDDKAPRVLRECLMDIAATCELVAQVFDGNATKTALWFKVPNPHLGNLPPCDWLRRGECEMLQRHVLEAARQGGEAALPVAQSNTDSLSPPIPPGKALLDARRDEILYLCQRYGVRSLAVFGSVLGQDFDPDRGEIDLAVEFAPSVEGATGRRYFDFKADLETLLKCRIDLVELNAMPGSRLRRSIIGAQTLLYDEAD